MGPTELQVVRNAKSEASAKVAEEKAKSEAARNQKEEAAKQAELNSEEKDAAERRELAAKAEKSGSLQKQIENKQKSVTARVAEMKAVSDAKEAGELSVKLEEDEKKAVAAEE